jgi:hypothetical protein
MFRTAKKTVLSIGLAETTMGVARLLAALAMQRRALSTLRLMVPVSLRQQWLQEWRHEC